VQHASDSSANPSGNLAARIRAGELRAFEELFRDQYAGLCAFANRYLHDPATAEDLVQELFANLWATHARLELHGSIRAYLFTAVRNRALNFRKHQLVERDWERDEALPDVRVLHRAPVAPDERLETSETHARLHAAIESLPERCRLVMQLRWREQMSYAEIAAVMGISMKGVEIQLSRGLQALRQRLGVPDVR
jgi:RNA polymerase sigma-70 factor, ECF subfamily